MLVVEGLCSSQSPFSPEKVKLRDARALLEPCWVCKHLYVQLATTQSCWGL